MNYGCDCRTAPATPGLLINRVGFKNSGKVIGWSEKPVQQELPRLIDYPRGLHPSGQSDHPWALPREKKKPCDFSTVGPRQPIWTINGLFQSCAPNRITDLLIDTRNRPIGQQKSLLCSFGPFLPFFGVQ